MSQRSCVLRAGLPPLGGMATWVVLSGFEAERPCVINAANSSSLNPAANLLVWRFLPRCGMPAPCGPWQPAQVAANNCWPCSAEGAAGTAGAAAVCSTGGVCSAAGSEAEDDGEAPELWPQPLKMAVSARPALKVSARRRLVLECGLVIIFFHNI